MGYKLIALDIDGTIRSPEYPISDRTRDAVAAARAAGAMVTLATGRTFPSAARNSAELDIAVPIAAAQGAHIGDPVSMRTLRHRPLTADLTRRALDAVDAHIGANGVGPGDMQVVAYHPGGVYVDRMTEWASAYGARNGISVDVEPDLRRIADAEPTRLVAVGDDCGIQDLEAGLQAALGDEMLITRSLPHFCEILHPRAGKDRALAWICGRYGIGREETVAFGNGYNDTHMLEWAALGVATEDAVPEALAVSDAVAPPVERDGVAQVLEDLLRQGMIG